MLSNLLFAAMDTTPETRSRKSASVFLSTGRVVVLNRGIGRALPFGAAPKGNVGPYAARNGLGVTGVATGSLGETLGPCPPVRRECLGAYTEPMASPYLARQKPEDRYQLIIKLHNA